MSTVGRICMIGTIALLATLWRGAPASARSFEMQAPGDMVLVVDVTKRGIGRLATPPVELDRAFLVKIDPDLKVLLNKFGPGSAPNRGDEIALVAGLGKSRSGSRLLATGPADLSVFLIADLSDLKPPKITKATETRRTLVIVRDLQTIVEAVIPLAADQAPSIKIAEDIVELEYKRASVVVAGTAQPGGDIKGVTTEITLTTGPAESWGLSLDLPVNRFDELKYDSESDSLVEVEAPGDFLAAINWWRGDIATPAEELSWPQRVGFKLIVSASKKPLDVIGLGVSIRVPPLEFLGQGLTGLQPFVGVAWRREDDTVLGPGVVTRDYADPQVLVGVSFDVSRLAKWRSKSEKGKVD